MRRYGRVIRRGAAGCISLADRHAGQTCHIGTGSPNKPEFEAEVSLSACVCLTNTLVADRGWRTECSNRFVKDVSFHQNASDSMCKIRSSVNVSSVGDYVFLRDIILCEALPARSCTFETSRPNLSWMMRSVSHSAWAILTSGAHGKYWAPRICVLLLTLLYACAALASDGLDPRRDVDQYGHRIWTSQNGIPGESVCQVLQTLEGYLWLRTSAGLVQFDGERFVRINPSVEGVPFREEVRTISKTTDGLLLVRGATRTNVYRSGHS